MITTGNGTISLIKNEYIEFVSHQHISNSRLEYLKQDVLAFNELLKGRKLPVISIIYKIDKLDTESEAYIRSELPKYFTKMALVSKSKWTFYIFKLVSTFISLPVTTNIFITKEDALQWINE